jgi:hypothetical protein
MKIVVYGLPLAAAVSLFAVVACNDVLGFDERTFDPCVQYCDAIQTTCVQKNAQYQDETSCLATCALIEPGDPDNPTGNTIACRNEAVKRAQTTQALDQHCSAAGPSGFDGSSQQVCGDRCTSYCELMAQICAGKSDVAALDLENCLTQPGLRSVERRDQGSRRLDPVPPLAPRGRLHDPGSALRSRGRRVEVRRRVFDDELVEHRHRDVIALSGWRRPRPASRT